MKLKKVPVLDMFGYIEGFECPSKRIKIVKCDKESADAVIVPNHYSHKAVSNSCINMLVIYNDRVEGAMQIGYGIRPKIKGDLDAESTREFDRMWLSDNMPKFSETIALSLSCESTYRQLTRKSSTSFHTPTHRQGKRVRFTRLVTTGTRVKSRRTFTSFLLENESIPLRCGTCTRREQWKL